jgi:YVTN family beta-propeller protein
MLAMAAVFGAPPAEAAPFAYVASEADGTVSVIDTDTNKLMVTVPAGRHLDNVAVSPDGKHVYVTDLNPPGSVLVIDTTTNTVAATVSIANTEGIAVNPDGKHAYVTSFSADPMSL